MQKYKNKLLILNYQLNEKYHDTKETSGWIAFTLYYSFSISVYNYFSKETDNYCESIVLSLAYLCISTLFYVFISNQYYKKAESIVFNKCYLVLLKNNSSVDLKKLIIEKIKCIKKIDLYNMEIPLFIIAIIFYTVTQFSILKLFKYCDSAIYSFIFIVYLPLSVIFLISVILIMVYVNIGCIANKFIKENVE